MKDDIHFLKLATEESLKSVGPHKYGALLVRDGKIVGIDHNRVRETSDPSAHAELNVIKQACQKLNIFNLPPGFTLYASHELCLMCFMCAVWAEVERVVYAIPASEQDEASYGFKDFGIKELDQRLTKPLKIEQINVDKSRGNL